jgi:phosphate:Na+ symporter
MIRSLVEGILPAFAGGSEEASARLLEQEAEADFIGDQIDDYLLQISRRNLNQDQSEIAVQLTEITTSLERIAEVYKRDIHPLIQRKTESSIEFSERGRERLVEFSELVLENYDRAIRAFEDKRTEVARQVVRSKPRVADLQQAFRSAHYDGLASDDPGAVAASEVHLDLVEDLRRINSHAESIAYTMLEGFLDARRKRDSQPQPDSASAAA